jgi:hypothetical protein
VLFAAVVSVPYTHAQEFRSPADPRGKLRLDAMRRGLLKALPDKFPDEASVREFMTDVSFRATFLQYRG